MPKGTLTKRNGHKLPEISETNGKIDLQVKNAEEVRALQEATGTTNEALISQTVKQVLSAVWARSNEQAEVAQSVLATMQDIRPRDSLESMLVSQMLSVHSMAMRVSHNAMLADQTAYGIDTNVNRATKLMRVFTEQVAALQKYRSKGHQKVTVEHVHVHPGGQAVVGDIHHQGGGGNHEK